MGKRRGTTTSKGPPAEAVEERKRAREPTQVTYQEREIAYRKTVEMDLVDPAVVRAMAFQGIPDAYDLRALYWKLLLMYLPPERSKWAEVLETKRGRYSAIKEFATRLDGPRPEPQVTTSYLDDYEDDELEDGKKEETGDKEEEKKEEEEEEAKPEAAAVEERPEEPKVERYVSKEQAWRDYYKDDPSLIVIEKDVTRTQPSMHFFGDEGVGGNAHGDALRSILFVYSRTNSALRYVQGMNEILAPIYYVFAHDPHNSEYAEPDAFFCFANLMAEIEGIFLQQFDSAMLDTQNPIGRYQGLLALLDRELFVSLAQKGMDPRFYVLRWLSLLFSQEFDLPDVLRLWDSLFGDATRFQFLLFFACAMIMREPVRSQLIAADFGPALTMLQNLSVPDVCPVISYASELMEATSPECLEPAYLAKVYAEAAAAGTAPPHALQQQQQQQQRSGLFNKLRSLKRKGHAGPASDGKK